MAEYQFNVKVQADNSDEAKTLLTAALSLLKTAKTQISANEFLTFAQKLEKKPHFVKTAVKIL